ncbi:MAG TPA: AMP-binding protein [Thermoanaerobaculia bacterium]|nr:AMP-binding protein [Thermoanaerobaculia bacterium]
MEAVEHSNQRRRNGDAEKLVELTRTVSREVHPEARLDETLGLDSSLDADFGLESLARAELIRRIEAEMGIQIPESLFASAGTPRDLLFGIARARHRTTGGPALPLQAVREVEGFRRAGSLAEVLEQHLAKRPDQVHIRLLGEERDEDITYRDLDLAARRIAAGILDHGVRPGSAVALMLPTSGDYFSSFFGVIAAGCVPVPIYPPARAAQLEEHLTRHAAILRNAEAALLITTDEAERVARLLEKHVPSVRAVAVPADLARRGELPSFTPRAQDDIVFLQYTSGSTGNPKGVVVTHANALANLRAVGEVIGLTSDDVIVSWLPLYHDMGLMSWLGGFYFAMPLISMSPLRFLSRPSRWLRAIEQFRGTISAAPNFAYEICATKIPDADIEGLDLSSWRLALNGAEAVSPETIRRFTERLALHGFRASTMFPVYGLAECTVALTFPPLGRVPRVEAVDRERFVTSGIAVPSADPTALRFAGCGEPIPQHEIRVVAPDEVELPDRHEGRIQFRGPSATRGYFANEEETRKLMHGTWLDSGDLGFTIGRELFITGRVKDLIIRAGRHVHPDELEKVVGTVDGVRRGCVAVFGTHDAAAQTERVVIVAETREQDRQRFREIEAAIRAAAVDSFAIAPDEVVLVPPHSVLKTSSGKIRRQATRATYESGTLGEPAPLWKQWMRLQTVALRPRLTRGARRVREIAYAWYALAAAALAAPAVWLSVVLTPGLARRRRLVSRHARLLLRLLGIGIEVRRRELPSGGAIFAANHASYIDGVVLAAVLPPNLSFVVKKEFIGRFYSRIFFSRIGVSFVERFDPRQSLHDAARLGHLAAGGQALAIFPEATFSRGAGLLPFRMGAFLTAAEAGVPIVPVTLRGTRTILRGDDWFPRRGNVEVVFGDPVTPPGRNWAAALEMHRRVRAEILGSCGEPDLEPVERRSKIEAPPVL